MTQYVKIDDEGTKAYYKDKELTILHREDGPAVEYADGDKAWWLNGERHREDGPALEWTNGYKAWYLNGEHHREDGPAVEGVYSTEWYRNGKLHRVDGPAVEWADGYKVWYLNGKKYTEAEFKAKMNLVKEYSVTQYVKIEDGNKFYYKDEEMTILHRENGPAAEYANGDKSWYLNGKQHRVDGPAYEGANGDKIWYLNWELHREDGPAIEGANGYKTWWLNDKRHREDGPAVERANGYKAWWLNGERHRVDGPAIEYADGTKEWWLNGEHCTEAEFKAKMTPMQQHLTESPKCIMSDGKLYRIVKGTKYELIPITEE